MCWYRPIPAESHTGEVAAWNESGAAFARFDVVAEPEELDVEGGVVGVGAGVDVERLAVCAA